MESQSLLEETNNKDQGTKATYKHEDKHSYPEGITIVVLLCIFFINRIGSQCISRKMGIDSLLLVLFG